MKTMDFSEIIIKIDPYLRFLSSRVKLKSGYINSDDIYQELLNHLWEQFRDGRLNGKNITYIKKSCWFFLKNYVRKFKEKVEYSDNVFNECIETKPLFETKSLIENRVIDTIFVKNILDANMSIKEKEIVNLTLQRLTTREIGKIVGLSHSRVVQVQKKFRNIVKKNY